MEDHSPAAQADLADAFSAFIASANRLESSHSQLHREVAELRRELEERNRALNSSHAENARMQLALREILDALPCGVAVLEFPSMKVAWLNPEGRKLLDLTGEDIDTARTLPAWVRPALAATCEGTHEHGYEQEISVEANGKSRWLAIRYSRMPDGASQTPASECAQVILIIRDVTAHKSAEQHREAARNSFAMAEMSSVLAHEIRNPLGSLELLTRCLEEDSRLSEESRRCVEHIQAGVRSLSATVCNVLCFHTPGSVAMRPFALAPVLKSSLAFVRPVAQEKKVGLALRENLSDAQIAGDPEGLKQVLLNLFCNALRHTASGGSITITARIEAAQEEAKAVVEFVDTGSGIDPGVLPHIFEPGFSTTGGSGLGLAVCRRIVEQHRGTISAQSRVEQGATFRLEIPTL